MVIAEPSRVAVIVVAVPEIDPVNAAVYEPFPWSVVEPMVPVEVPPERAKRTVLPPELAKFPTASLATRVSVT